MYDYNYKYKKYFIQFIKWNNLLFHYYGDIILLYTLIIIHNKLYYFRHVRRNDDN